MSFKSIVDATSSWKYSVTMNLEDKVLSFRDGATIKNPTEKVSIFRRITATIAFGALIIAHAIEALVRTLFALIATPFLYFSKNDPQMQKTRTYAIDSVIDHWKELFFRLRYIKDGFKSQAFALDPSIIKHRISRTVSQAIRRIEMERRFALIFFQKENTIFSKTGWIDTFQSSSSIAKTQKALKKSMTKTLNSLEKTLDNAKLQESLQKNYHHLLEFGETIAATAPAKIQKLLGDFSKKGPIELILNPNPGK